MFIIVFFFLLKRSFEFDMLVLTLAGISKNMFFINHGQNEISQQETRSHMNSHEASFIVELCRYIILQGYGKLNFI